ncbi:MAG TPA: PGPGW domain-containing protein [Steroidobacteraceae bacterium]|nr:PGPGW domain-containing protein [Steroidobacteraceae bacterium]HRX90051.1 PGPGW domain-containing protein [Steroidobacteraceae bacterium]
MFHPKHPLYLPYRYAKRIVIAIVGGTVLLLGLIMIVTPGPALVVIPIGLGILGLEFAWARAWLKRIKQKGTQLADAVRNRNGHRPGGTVPPGPEQL